LKKAYIAFQPNNDDDNQSVGCLSPIATGNWGCGAFGGNLHLKFLQQLISSSQANRGMIYCTFDDAQLKDELKEFSETLVNHNITVGQLICAFLKCFDNHEFTPNEVFRPLLKHLNAVNTS